MTTSPPPDAAFASLDDFPATRAEGLRRLADFVPRAARAYAEGRNTDGGPAARGNVSVLSRALRYRLVTEREVVAAVLARHDAEAAGKFIGEVLWRTYWKGWLELRPGPPAGWSGRAAAAADAVRRATCQCQQWTRTADAR